MLLFRWFFDHQQFVAAVVQHFDGNLFASDERGAGIAAQGVPYGGVKVGVDGLADVVPSGSAGEEYLPGAETLPVIIGIQHPARDIVATHGVRLHCGGIESIQAVESDLPEVFSVFFFGSFLQGYVRQTDDGKQLTGTGVFQQVEHDQVGAGLHIGGRDAESDLALFDGFARRRFYGKSDDQQAGIGFVVGFFGGFDYGAFADGAVGGTENTTTG